MTTKTPDPFPNDWEQVHQTPLHRFVDHMTIRDMMIRSSAWDLPDSVAGVVRIENENGTITEKVMNNTGSLYRLTNSLESQGINFVAYDRESMYCTYVVDTGQD
jgi:hypothetical protein